MNTSMVKTESIPETIYPWYHYGWPWFLISIPFVSIILGSTMLYLALQANNSLVVDDYYKEGKAYNLIIERDKLASLLGITATVSEMSEGIVLQLERDKLTDTPEFLLDDARKADTHFKMPDALLMRWVHVTQAEHDGATSLLSIGGSRYIAQNVTLPRQGKYRLHIEPLSREAQHSKAVVSTESNWRLISELTGFTAQAPIVISAPGLDKVLNVDSLQ